MGCCCGRVWGVPLGHGELAAAGSGRWAVGVLRGCVGRGEPRTGFFVIVLGAGGAASGSRDPRLLTGRPYGTRRVGRGAMYLGRCARLVWVGLLARGKGGGYVLGGGGAACRGVGLLLC